MAVNSNLLFKVLVYSVELNSYHAQLSSLAGPKNSFAESIDFNWLTANIMDQQMKEQTAR